MASRKRDQKTHTNEHTRDNGELPWAIVYYLTPEGSAPALQFLDTCPGTIDALTRAASGRHFWFDSSRKDSRHSCEVARRERRHAYVRKD
jgi:hypothetical protein